MTGIRSNGENEHLYQKVVLNNVYKEGKNSAYGKMVNFE